MLWSQAPQFSMCPSGGFSPLSIYASQLSRIKNEAVLQSPPPYIQGVFASHLVDIANSTSVIPLSPLFGSPRGIACQTTVRAPHVLAMIYQPALNADWRLVTGEADSTAPYNARSIGQYKHRFELTASTAGTKVLVVRTSCLNGVRPSQPENSTPIFRHSKMAGGGNKIEADAPYPQPGSVAL